MVRRAAVGEAAVLLGSVAADGARRLTGAFLQASKTKLGSMMSGFACTVRGAGGKILSRFGLAQADGDLEVSEPASPASA